MKTLVVRTSNVLTRLMHCDILIILALNLMEDVKIHIWEDFWSILI